MPFLCLYKIRFHEKYEVDPHFRGVGHIFWRPRVANIFAYNKTNHVNIYVMNALDRTYVAAEFSSVNGLPDTYPISLALIAACLNEQLAVDPDMTNSEFVVWFTNNILVSASSLSEYFVPAFAGAVATIRPPTP